MNIAQNVERSRKRYPNKPALLFHEQSYTFKELDQMANRVADALTALGVQIGDRVALFLPNVPEFVFAYLGILKIGAVAVSVNASLRKDEVTFLLEDSGAVAIFTTAQLCSEVMTQEMATLRHVIVCDGPPNRATTYAMKALLNQASTEWQAEEMTAEAPAAIVYTSGTMGFPKGATLSHGNIVSNMAAKKQYCGMHPSDRILLFVPLFHCFGQNAILNSGLYAGSTVILLPKFEPEAVLAAIFEYGITMFFGVPIAYILLFDRASKKQMKSVRYYFSAAAPLPLEIAHNWQEEYGMPIYQGYGLTETSPFASYNHHRLYKLGSIGTPIQGVEMKIVDIDHAGEVGIGEWGEIVVRGPNVMLGYWNRPVETAQVIKQGWFHTGDVGLMDDDGYFFIVDRVKDMINVGGLKVYPTEVENILYQHPAVSEVVVYGTPDKVLGERVKANIVLKQNITVTKEEMTVFCRQHIAAFKVPSTVQFVDALPKNPTGKVLRRALRERSLPED